MNSVLIFFAIIALSGMEADGSNEISKELWIIEASANHAADPSRIVQLMMNAFVRPSPKKIVRSGPIDLDTHRWLKKFATESQQSAITPVERAPASITSADSSENSESGLSAALKWLQKSSSTRK